VHKPDRLDRIAQALVALAALFALGNGLIMLADPFGWYDLVGTVKATGPANAHFIRDIGLAYLLSAALLGYAAGLLALRWGAGLAGAGWLLAHGLLHVWEVMAGICAAGIFWQEAPGTLGPPLLALIGIAMMLARQRMAPFPLPDGLFVRAAEGIAPGEMGYLQRLDALPGGALEKFRHFVPASAHRCIAPAEFHAAVRIGATRAEDCGPCTLIAARAALADGVPRELVQAMLEDTLPQGDLAQLLAWGRAVALNDPSAAVLGEVIAARHGAAVRDELALAAAMVRTYPALKRGLGLATSCSAVPLKL
jgi:hypothetical protein